MVPRWGDQELLHLPKEGIQEFPSRSVKPGCFTIKFLLLRGNKEKIKRGESENLSFFFLIIININKRKLRTTMQLLASSAVRTASLLLPIPHGNSSLPVPNKSSDKHQSRSHANTACTGRRASIHTNYTYTIVLPSFETPSLRELLNAPTDP